MEIEPHEDDVFYDGLGMKIWEKRHFHITRLLESHKIKRVRSSSLLRDPFYTLFSVMILLTSKISRYVISDAMTESL